MGKRTSNLPPTIKGLRSWLKGSTEGRELLAALAEEVLEEKCRACQQIRPYPKVLVVLRRLGNHPGAEVYAEEGVTLRLLEMPDAPEELGAKLEELLEAKVPKSWRSLVGLPARRIHREVFRGVSLKEALYYSETRDLIGEIQTEGG